jgi:RimJ/RimL family protein N-acetyltransferase
VRLRFREMSDGDLDDLAALLGDPEVMRYYPTPKTREQAQDWIDWNRRNYAEHGFGLWVIETLDGCFVGDCGLTWQEVNGVPDVEVGYHVRTALHGQGFATEAAAACLSAARELGVERLTANVRADNFPSQRVAQKIGLTEWTRATAHGHDLIVFGAVLA